MVGDGIIVESKASFKITWDNLGNNKQPVWNQNKQEIIIHESDIYPDLMYTNMSGLATYYKYTNIDSLLNLVKQINSYIDNKINVSENSKTSIKSIANKEYPIANKEYPIATQTSNVPSKQVRGGVPSTIENPPNTSTYQDDITNEPQLENPPDSSSELEETSKYKVIVYGKELSFIDAQLNNENIEIRHFVSKNLYRKINNEIIDNTEKIWIEIITKTKTYKFSMSEFGQTEDGVNLLVEILPTIQLVITPSENNSVTKNTEIDDDIYFNELSKIKNSDIEKERYRKSKEETEKMAKMAKSIK